MAITRHDSVQRIAFGRVLTPQFAGHEGHSYVLGLGKRPKAAKGGLSLVRKEAPLDDGIYTQLEKALPELKKHALSDESPYANKDGLVAAFADQVFSGIKNDDLLGMIDRLIENRPYISPQAEMMFPRNPTIYPPLRFDPEFLTPDDLSSAGEILSQAGRTVPDEATGGHFFTLTHPMESYLLSVAALRVRGVSAYPASAILPGEQGEIYHPLITIVDLTKEVPLTTFDLMGTHPPMGSVDIMSDVAVKAVTFAMLAQVRIMHLAAEMFLQNQQGRELSMEELKNQLDRVADSLFESHRRWPGCHFISSTLGFAVQDLAEVLMHIELSGAQANMDALIAENPAFGMPGFLEQQVEAASMQTALRFAEHIKHELSLRIARSS